MTGLEKKLVLRALDQPEQLTEWENDFISSIADKEDSELTPRQAEVLLKQIWPKLQREIV